MARKIWKPPVGSKVWFVCEHYDERPGHIGYEFMVYQGEVKEYYTGNWTDVTIRYKSEEGPIRLIDITLRADKRKVFDNPRDAALYAQELTDEYLKHNSWYRTSLPRRWEKYLQEGTENG